MNPLLTFVLHGHDAEHNTLATFLREPSPNRHNRSNAETTIRTTSRSKRRGSARLGCRPQGLVTTSRSKKSATWHHFGDTERIRNEKAK